MTKTTRIAVLDTYTANPGDLSWTELEALGTVTLYDRTPDDEIVARARNAEIVLTNKTPIGRETLSRLPELRYIGVLATGYNEIDHRAARERGVIVTNVPGYSSDSVAQLTIALLLELCRGVGSHSRAVLKGDWSRCPDFCFCLSPQMELTGKILGIVGFGQIGRRVGRIAATMGMRIIAERRRSDAIPEDIPDFRWVDRDTLFREADVVSLHCPLTNDNVGMIDRETLEKMKPSAFLINTARGKLIVENDLAEALKNGVIAGAGLDVLSEEPPPADNPLPTAPNCLITPHIAWTTREARSRLVAIAIANVRAFLSGAPINVVN